MTWSEFWWHVAANVVGNLLFWTPILIWAFRELKP
jgi:hypothetical protein